MKQCLVLVTLEEDATADAYLTHWLLLRASLLLTSMLPSEEGFADPTGWRH